MAESLLSLCKAVGQIASPGNKAKRSYACNQLTLSTEAHTYNSSIWEVEAGRQEIKDSQPQLQSDSNHSLSYLRPCLKQAKQVNKQQTKILFTERFFVFWLPCA